MMGKPGVAGTRITVELILEKLAAGESVERILEAHPWLTREAVLVAIAFAKEALRADAPLQHLLQTQSGGTPLATKTRAGLAPMKERPSPI
ncbi:MAG: DUF433 domain-containing protein [Roseiflexaceae bacterium]|nr:DUF433 domain-containing protein [Roseiflexus sp.]MDW8145661.1 DUF433 domain-containing protein [Roseiflexaceae bacterium]